MFQGPLIPHNNILAIVQAHSHRHEYDLDAEWEPPWDVDNNGPSLTCESDDALDEDGKECSEDWQVEVEEWKKSTLPPSDNALAIRGPTALSLKRLRTSY